MQSQTKHAGCHSSKEPRQRHDPYIFMVINNQGGDEKEEGWVFKWQLGEYGRGHSESVALGLAADALMVPWSKASLNQRDSWVSSPHAKRKGKNISATFTKCMSSFNIIIIASLLHLQGCIDFRGGLINLLFATGPLLSQECRYLLITPFGNGKLMKEAAL